MRARLDRDGPMLAICDFCGKTQHEVATIVMGAQDVAICNECVAVAADVVSRNLPASAPKKE